MYAPSWCRVCGEPKGCHLATCPELTPTSLKVRGDILGLSDYDNGFIAGAEAMREAAALMLERAQQPAAALGVCMMKLPEKPA